MSVYLAIVAAPAAAAAWLVTRFRRRRTHNSIELLSGPTDFLSARTRLGLLKGSNGIRWSRQ